MNTTNGQLNNSRKSAKHVAYLLKMYPRFSQTFVVNEILELERQNLPVRIVSMRRPDEGMFHESVCRVQAKAHYLPETALGALAKTWSAHTTRLRQHPRGYMRAAGTALRQAGATWSDLMQAGHLLAWTKKQNVKHVHVHFGTNEATVALLANMIGGLSYSMTLHAFDIFRDNVNRVLLSRKINASRFTVTVSEFNRRYLVDHMPGLNAEKVRVCYNGIDVERFCTDGDVSSMQNSTILAVGRLIEKKGFTHLIEAIGNLRTQGLPVSCKIVGEGRERPRLLKQIKDANLTSQIELTGPLKQGAVLQLMRQSSCFVLPCVQAADGNIDALPTVLLEALAAGCPAISTRLSGIPEIIEDQVSGLLVEPGDVVGLGRAIQRILLSPTLAERLARDGRQRADDRFDIRRNVAVLHEWLTEGAGKRPYRRQPDRVSPVRPVVAIGETVSA